jgi:hypothetical protein
VGRPTGDSRTRTIVIMSLVTSIEGDDGIIDEPVTRCERKLGVSDRLTMVLDAIDKAGVSGVTAAKPPPNPA